MACLASRLEAMASSGTGVPASGLDFPIGPKDEPLDIFCGKAHCYQQSVTRCWVADGETGWLAGVTSLPLIGSGCETELRSDAPHPIVGHHSDLTTSDLNAAYITGLLPVGEDVIRASLFCLALSLAGSQARGPQPTSGLRSRSHY